MSFPTNIKGRARFLLGRKWGLASAIARHKLRMERGPDWHTIRMRSLHDLKGTVVREGCTYFGDGRVVPWCMRRSVAGRVNQYDVLAGNEIWRTAGKRRLPVFIRP